MLNIRQESSQHPGLLLIWFEPGVKKKQPWQQVGIWTPSGSFLNGHQGA